MLYRVQGEIRLDMECQDPGPHRTLPYDTLMLLKPVLQHGAISLQPEEWNGFTIDDIVREIIFRILRFPKSNGCEECHAVRGEHKNVEKIEPQISSFMFSNAWSSKLSTHKRAELTDRPHPAARSPTQDTMCKNQHLRRLQVCGTRLERVDSQFPAFKWLSN